ncbi:hypothetical protein, partial [Rugosimonospora africana]|uniref:hypothetical protein n=1 Tax=Rugosimonospora africana TaxID=556532 RepID=UPI0019426A38
MLTTKRQIPATQHLIDRLALPPQISQQSIRVIGVIPRHDGRSIDTGVTAEPPLQGVRVIVDEPPLLRQLIE